MALTDGEGRTVKGSFEGVIEVGQVIKTALESCGGDSGIGLEQEFAAVLEPPTRPTVSARAIATLFAGCPARTAFPENPTAPLSPAMASTMRGSNASIRPFAVHPEGRPEARSARNGWHTGRPVHADCPVG